MQTIVYTRYGGPDALQLQEIDKPIPKSNEVLVNVRAVSINYGDIVARNFKNIPGSQFNMPFLFYILARFSFGFNKPKRKVLGSAFAGIVETAGENNGSFKKGDHVIGYTGEKMGACAQYICPPENSILAHKPGNLTFEEASTLPYGALMALSLLKKTGLEKDKKVLIIGAAGGIGSAAVQLAKNFYGAKVTGICSTPSMAYVKNLGADTVIDYKDKSSADNGETYDLVFDVLGKGASVSYKKLLKPGGVYLLASFKSPQLLQMLRTYFSDNSKVICSLAIPKPEDLRFINALVEEGKLKPVVEKVFPLEKANEAHSYYESVSRTGHVVITIDGAQ